MKTVVMEDYLALRVPAGFNDAIAKAARREGESLSAFVRRTLARELRKQRIEPFPHNEQRGAA